MASRTLTADDLTGPVLAVAVAGAALTVGLGPGPAATLTMGTAVALVALRIAWQDLTDFTIPDAATLALGLLGLVSRIGDGLLEGESVGAALMLPALDGTLCGGTLLALRELYYRRRGHDGIGLGDVKLGAAGGVLLGTGGLSWAILGASLAGLALVLARRLRPARDGIRVSDRVAFGAFLAPALWLAWLVGQSQAGSGSL